MLESVNVINEKIIKKLEKDLVGYYKFKEGNDLNSVVSEILNNRTLNLYLLSFLPKDNGILLGNTSYFDDIRVDIHYGLTVNFADSPRKTELFIVHSVDDFFKQKREGFKIEDLGFCFPDYSRTHEYFEGWPSSIEFIEDFNRIFLSDNLKDYLIPLKR